MTEKELRRLSRMELLEMLVEQSREAERLRAELEQAQERLSAREIMLDEAGSIAEAALRINGVYEAAQRAAEQYLENIRQLNERQSEVIARRETESRAASERLLEDTRQKCARLEAESQRKLEETQRECTRLETETRSHCQSMTKEAEAAANTYWISASERLKKLQQLIAGENGAPQAEGQP